jgi:Uma2 family endonuclease
MSEHIEVDTRYTVANYFALVRDGLLPSDEHVELLEGVVVAEPPQDPEHSASASQIDRALREAIRGRAAIRVQCPIVLGKYSAPEPDVAVVPGTEADYADAHPTAAVLVVEVARSSLPQDRLSKGRIYAAAEIPEYWLVNLRDDCVEVYRHPDPAARTYAERRVARRGERVVLLGFPDASLAVDDLLPRRNTQSLKSGR